MDAPKLANICARCIGIQERLLQVPDAELGVGAFREIREEWTWLTEELNSIGGELASLPPSIAGPIKEIARIVNEAAIGPAYGDVCKVLKDSEIGRLGQSAWKEVSRHHRPPAVAWAASKLALPTATPSSQRGLPTLLEFLDELNARFAALAKRHWLHDQVVTWLRRPHPKAEDGEQRPDPVPVWPYNEVTWSIPAQCAALAAVHCGYFKGPPLFTLPEEFGTNEFWDPGNEGGIRWTVLMSYMRNELPPDAVVSLRAMLWNVDVAWEAEQDVGPGDDTTIAPEAATGFLGGSALADALGVHTTRRDAFFRQLERQRITLGDDCWHEVREPRPNSPRYLYRADAPKVRDLAAGYSSAKPA